MQSILYVVNNFNVALDIEKVFEILFSKGHWKKCGHFLAIGCALENISEQGFGKYFRTMTLIKISCG